MATEIGKNNGERCKSERKEEMGKIKKNKVDIKRHKLPYNRTTPLSRTQKRQIYMKTK